MADSAVNIYAKEFSDNIMLLLAQKGTKMMNYVMLRNKIKGDRFTQERMGTWAMSTKSQGVQSTPQNDPGYTRRTCVLTTYNDARTLAHDDNLKTVVEVTSPWVERAVDTYGKQIDVVVYAALGGDALAGRDAGTTVALPAGQKLATVAGEVLDTDFIVDVKTKLDAADVPEGDRYVMIHPEDLNAMLKDTTLTSSDYNSIKALVKGDFDTWMGFKWISTTAATQGVCYFYHKSGIVLGMNETPKVRIDERKDLSYATQIYYELNIGATRLEEERVVEVTITPAA